MQTEEPTPHRAHLPFLNRFPYPWLALGTASIAAFLGPLEGNLVIVSLPSLGRAFDVPAANVVWVMVATTLVTLGLALPVASLSDQVGRRRLFRLGFWVFIAGAVISLSAPNLEVLLGGRAIQGIGTGLFASTRNAIAVEALPMHRRGLAMGVILSSVGLGATVAPFLGGWLLATFGWRAVFAAEIPLALIGALASFVVLSPEKDAERTRRKFDVLGAVFIFGALGGLLIAGNRLPSLGLGSPLILIFGGGGLLLLVLFFWQETRAAHPVLDLSLFRIRSFSVPTIGLILQMLSFTTAVTLLPFFLEEALGFSPAEAGAVFAVGAFALFLGSLPGGALYDRLGMRRIALGSLSVMTLAFIGLATLSETSSIVFVIAILGVIGVMEGAFQSSTSAAQISAVPPERLSTGAALFVVGIMLPLSAGLALGGTLFSARLEVHELALGVGPTAVAAAYREIALVGTGFALAALLTHLLFGRSRESSVEHSQI